MERIKFLLIMMELHVTNLFKLFSGTDTSASRKLDFALVLVELAHVLVDTLTQLVAIIFLASNSLFRVVFLFFVTVKLFPQFFCFFAKSVNSKMVNVEGVLVFSDPFLLDFTISLSLVWLVLFGSSQVSTVVKRHVCDCGLLPCLFLLPLLFFFFFLLFTFFPSIHRSEETCLRLRPSSLPLPPPSSFLLLLPSFYVLPSLQPCVVFLFLGEFWLVRYEQLCELRSCREVFAALLHPSSFLRSALR